MRDHTKLRAFELADEVAVRRLSENGYFSQSLRQAQIIILEIFQCIPVVIIFAFLDLGKNISFSDSLLGLSKRLGFLRNHDSSLIEPKIVETEKVLNGLIRALRDD